MATLKDLLVSGPARVIGNITGNKFVKEGGTSSQFLKADGSVDTNSYSTTSHNHSGVYKPVQTAVSDPTASSTTSTTFIDSISQNTNGVITATKKTLPSYASSSHTHTTTIATSSATNQITLAFGTKYAITAGGTSYVFTMPSLGTTSTTAAAGNHTHSGYLTSSSSLNAANLTGTIPSGCYSDNNNFGTVLVETSGGDAAKVGIVDFPYALNTGNCFILYLKQDNTVANAKLNIMDTGAKDVYLDGAKVTASNWKAGTYLFYYDGARYHTSSRNPFSDANTTYTIGTGDSNGQIKVTPSSGNAYNVNVKGLGSAAYTASTAYATSSHTHGNIQNGGTLQTNDITIGNGDKLVVTDSSDSSKVARTSISFDGSTTSQVLSRKGTWVNLPTDTDTQVTQSLDLDSSKWRPILLSSLAGDSINGANLLTDETTSGIYYTPKIAINTGDGFISAQGFIYGEGSTDGFLKGDGTLDTNTYSLSNHTHSGYASSSHSHGSITSGGAISSGTALANGDAIVFSDSSDSSKLKKSTITFDGSTTTKFLSQKGTWETPSGGGGSTVVGKTVELSTSNQALITVNGSNSGNVKLPDNCPWIADPANHHDVIGGVTPIFRADSPRVMVGSNIGSFSDIQDVTGVNTQFLFPDVASSHTLYALPVTMDSHGRLFVLISEQLTTDIFLNCGMIPDASALRGK